MSERSSIPKRRSIRIPAFDYSQSGGYFVTICAFHKRCLFGEIENSCVRLNRLGDIATACWEEIPTHFPHITLADWVVMPNHLHGIVKIGERARRAVPLPNIHRPESFQRPVSGSIPTIIRSYKSAVTKRVRESLSQPDYQVWQSNYFEAILRSAKEFDAAVRYIRENPKTWQLDSDNPSPR
jgi:putative transposase